MSLANEIQSGRFNRFAQKLLGIKGGPPVPTVSSDFQNVINFQDMQALAFYLASIDMFGFAVTFTGLAANISFLEIRNPTTSNVGIELVLAVGYETAAADQFGLNLYKDATVDQGTLLSGSSALPWDRRSQRVAPSAIVSWNAGAAFTSPSVAAKARTILQLAGPINTPVQLIQQNITVPLLPGDAAGISTVNTAVQLSATLWWRERLIEESERQ